MWFDAVGNRLPVPLFPGFDTLGTLEHIMRTGHEHTWFVLNQRIIKREFALSGSEQNPDLTHRDLRTVAARATSRSQAPGPVEAFKQHGVDFVVSTDLAELVRGMNAIPEPPMRDFAQMEGEVRAGDRGVENPYSKDMQMVAVGGARLYRGDRLLRTAKPHRLLDPGAGPLIAVRLNILTRKTLGGLETDLSARVLGANGEPVPGLYAAGAVAGFGGGGMHGDRSLECTFLGGCMFSGRAAGLAAAATIA